jgi:hypothetical protein
MAELIAQIFGMVFVGIIMICIGGSIVTYVLGSIEKPNNKQNKKLLDNMSKMDKK